MTEPIRRSVDANGVRLNVYVLNGPERAERAVPLLMLHGMRDLALSLMPVATELAADRSVYLLDLRGHGGSDRPGNYALPQFVFDAHRVITDLIIGQGPGESARYWSQVRCPTCIVSGALAGEYWGRALPADAGWDGSFAPGELEARTALFQDAEHLLIENAGHMIHFDQPEELAAVTRQFLRRKL